MPYIYTPVPFINCDVLHISIHVLLYCQRFSILLSVKWSVMYVMLFFYRLTFNDQIA